MPLMRSTSDSAGRAEARSRPEGVAWDVLKDPRRLGGTRRADLDALVADLRRSARRERGSGARTLCARKSRGYRRLSTIRTVIFLIAGKVDFPPLNAHVP